MLVGGCLAGLAVFSRYPITNCRVVHVNGLEKLQHASLVPPHRKPTGQPGIRSYGFPGFAPIQHGVARPPDTVCLMCVCVCVG